MIFLLRMCIISLPQRLGSGAYGEVWKASYRGQDVAVKILHKALTEKLPKDFDRELSILREFKSPYTVVFLGICKKPHPCLVMECCARGSLHDLLEKPHGSVPCDWSYTISYALQVLPSWCEV
jgi:serine/threonine protein kinase